MNIPGINEIAFLVPVLALAALWLFCLFDALSTPLEAWEKARRNKVIWIAVIFFASFLGSLVYLVMVRPSLKTYR